MSRLCFIVNPIAGHGRALKVWKRIEPLAARLGQFSVKFTERPRHGQELARQAALEGYDRVVALGGDGTLNEVGNGLVGTGTAMAVVPTGTGNDWVRTVGIPKDPEEAVRIAFQGRRAKSDVGLAVGHRHFINVAGIGFDAEVCRRVNDYGPVLKTVGGTLPSVLGVLGTLFHFTGADVVCNLDGEERPLDRVILLTIGIGRFFGGGMKILPEAQLDDGLFDIIWGEHIGRWELLKLLGKVYKGEHLRDPKVEFARARRLTVTGSPEVVFHLDGDIAGTLPVTFELVPGGLDVILP